jgi:hypothetical protein
VAHPKPEEVGEESGHTVNILLKDYDLLDLQEPENKRRTFNGHRVGISTEFIIPGGIC